MTYQYRVTGNGNDQIFTDRRAARAAYDEARRLNHHLPYRVTTIKRENV